MNVAGGTFDVERIRARFPLGIFLGHHAVLDQQAAQALAGLLAFFQRLLQLLP